MMGDGLGRFECLRCDILEWSIHPVYNIVSIAQRPPVADARSLNADRCISKMLYKRRGRVVSPGEHPFLADLLHTLDLIAYPEFHPFLEAHSALGPLAHLRDVLLDVLQRA